MKTVEQALRSRCCVTGCGVEVTQDEINANRGYYEHGPGDYCIAEGCMAWRWGQYKKYDGGSLDYDSQRQSDERGFCGRAGGGTGRS